jgi:CheY-like chemotaxis protein
LDNHRPRILVVEDSLLIAMEVEDLAAQCRCAVVGPAGSVVAALAAVREEPLDAAILDINLGDELVWPVADALAARDVPFVLATGYSAMDVPDRFRRWPRLTKPLSLEPLCDALAQIGAVRDRSLL